ncbi:TonB-dependent receptor [Gluconacetobacter liquefaciens]|uniref:TonB-dependent receptor n=2 Tax=Gluconacetobacter liquefaciens TaxID=89584 RepID=A0A370G3H8_GLULI|nr:TonB-dependent receptor [Gluconacetobacter liquefaciens]
MDGLRRQIMRCNKVRLAVFSFATALATVTVRTPALAEQGGLPDRQQVFSIPPGDLRTALSQFSRMTGIQVIVSPDSVAGRHTNGVTGTYRAREALMLMLGGTQLTPSINGGIVALRTGPDVLPARDTDRHAALDRPNGITANAGENIVVSGYRASLRAAQDYKRNAVGMEDDILAQDIASFPDLNLAESLQRIPGITINRDSGEGRQITLRGLGPDFTRTQLNGMEVLSNTASGMDNRGGVSRTRAFDFSLFASELFNRVSVQKSYAADQDEGGIAGTVQLYTAKPFDYPGSKFVVSAQGQNNTNTSGVTPRVVAMASDRWGDFGALASIAYSEIHSNEYGYRNWGWNKVQYKPGNIGPDISPETAALLEGGTIYAPQAESPSTWWTDRKRLGATAALQYHHDRFKADIDLLYGRLSDHRDDYAIAAAGSNALTGTPIGGTQVIQSATIVGNTLEAANYTGVDQRSEHHIIDNHTDFYQAVGNFSWQATNHLKFTALGGYEESDFRQPVFDKVFMEAKNHAFGFNNLSVEPYNIYGFDLKNPDAWQLQRLDTQENSITSRYANGKLNGIYKLDQHSSFEVGGEYKDFTNGGYQYNNKVFHNIPTDTIIPDNLKETIRRSSQIDYIVGKVNGVFDYIGDPRNLNAKYLMAGTDYQVEEKTWATYAQYDLDTEVFGMRLRANAGVRYYNTDLISTGHVVTTTNGVSQLTPIVATVSRHSVLPAANMALSVTRSLLFRASVNQNVNRPALADLAAAGTLTTRPNGGTVTFGNPYLKPYKATSVEGGFEYYMQNKGFASFSFFYKDMQSFTTTQNVQIPYSQTGLPMSLLVQGEDANTIFDVSKPVNGPGADIKGVEIAFQHDFDFLPGFLRHFGINMNGTWFDGHQVAIINGVNHRIPLLNLSKWAANATLYYDTDKWGARISTAYRSRYLTSTGSNGNVGDGIRATNNVDAQAHYNVTPHVRAVISAINITNQPIEQFADLTANRTEAYTTNGRNFTFGVTADF